MTLPQHQQMQLMIFSQKAPSCWASTVLPLGHRLDGPLTVCLSDTVLTLSTHHMEPITTKRPHPHSGVQSLDTPAIIQDPVPKDRKKGTQGMTLYITPDGAVPSPVSQTIFWLDPSTGGWYQKHPDMGYCRVELTKDQARQLVPHDQTPTARVTESGLFPPIHSLSSIAQSALDPYASATLSTEPSAPAENTLADTVVVVTSAAVPTVRFNPLQTPAYDSTVLEEVPVPVNTVRPELPRPSKIKELVDMETLRVVTSVLKVVPLTTVTPSPQADKSRVSPYMQLSGVAGVDYFVESATCLRCKETGSHALVCSLQHEYPTALILDSKGFCLQARFNTQPPKPSNYGLEPYTYYPIRGMVAYQFQQQPGKTSRDRYLHKIDLQVPPLQCPLASSTPVYGHDYAIVHESQREHLRPLEEASSSSPNSSWDEAAKGLGDPWKAEGGAPRRSDESSDDLSVQEQPFDGDVPLFPETVVRHKNRSVPQESEKEILPGSEPVVRGANEERTKRESTDPKRFHYQNPPIWTTPTGLILIGWRMRCPVCYHQDGHSATCSERWELPIILWIQPMFIHGIVHYMTYADGEWWRDQDPKLHQLWGRGHRVHRLDEGTDCLLEWGALFPKGKHSEQMESRKFEGDVPNLDLTTDSTQG